MIILNVILYEHHHQVIVTIHSFIYYKDLYSSSSRRTIQKYSQPKRGHITQIGAVEGMFESGFLDVIGEQRGDYARLRDQAPRKHDPAW